MNAVDKLHPETRTMADGTVQHRCMNERCHAQWFDHTSKGRPAKFCSTACRVMAHRDEKERRKREEQRLQREAYLARVTAEHRRDWVRYLREVIPSNSRMTTPKIEELYETLLSDGRIEAPFPQRRIF